MRVYTFTIEYARVFCNLHRWVQMMRYVVRGEVIKLVGSRDVDRVAYLGLSNVLVAIM